MSELQFKGFHHLRFWVGNAKQAATFYSVRFGLHIVGYRGLETHDRTRCAYVLQKNNVRIVLESPLEPAETEINSHIAKHGDGVKDICFHVDSLDTVFSYAKAHGATVIAEPWTESDQHGTVRFATIATYGDTVHTLVETKGYKGPFLPGYLMRAENGGSGFFSLVLRDPLEDMLPDTLLSFIDHVVGNQPDGEMVSAAQLYERQLGFKRFWSVDDSQIHTEYSALRSIVMTDTDETIKMPINEPAAARRKSQIQEYVDYYGGAGVQHIALNTDNIIAAVSALRNRGVEFLRVPKSYYSTLRTRLATAKITVSECLDKIEELAILIDYDEHGYLLQIFTKPVEDRPTLFFEVIQRHNHSGFGVGNFKSLFEAIEIEQEKRGNL